MFHLNYMPMKKFLILLSIGLFLTLVFVPPVFSDVSRGNEICFVQDNVDVQIIVEDFDFEIPVSQIAISPNIGVQQISTLQDLYKTNVLSINNNVDTYNEMNNCMTFPGNNSNFSMNTLHERYVKCYSALHSVNLSLVKKCEVIGIGEYLFTYYYII